MNIMKKLAVLAIAAAVVLTGCSNSFSGSGTDAGVLAAANQANNWGTAGLNAPTIGGTLSAVTTPTTQIITLDFSANPGDMIDYSTIPAAVTIHNLASAATATSVVTQGAVIPFTVKEVRGDIAYLLVNLTGASATIEVTINSTLLTGKNGSLKLDEDNDGTQGEANDDDIYEYLGVTGGTAIATFGVQRDPRYGFNISAPTFSVVAPATTRNTLSCTYDRMTPNGAGPDLADYKTLFDAHIVIQKYVPATNTWTTVTPISSTYVTTTGVWTVTFTALAVNETVRANGVDLQAIQSTAAFYGFIQRMVMDNRVTVMYGAPVTQADPTELGAGASDTAFAVSTQFSANGTSGSIIINLALGTIGNKGMVESTFTAANVKIYDTAKNVFVPFVSATFGYGAGVIPAATTDPKTQIVVALDPTYKATGDAFEIWVGPGLTTLGDTVPGIVPLHFGDAANISTFLPYGFRALDSDFSTL